MRLDLGKARSEIVSILRNRPQRFLSESLKRRIWAGFRGRRADFLWGTLYNWLHAHLGDEEKP